MMKLVKFVTGEEVIAEFAEGELVYKLDKPVKVVLMPDGSAGMMPFLALAKTDTISVSRSHVIYVADPDDELVNIYNSRFGSGLVVPSGGLDLGVIGGLGGN